MKSVFCAFASLFFILNLSAYEVLNDIGETYEIKDSDMLDEMKKAYDDIDKEALRTKIIAGVRDQLRGRLEFPSCKITQTRIIKKQQKARGFKFDEFDIDIKPPNSISNNYGLKVAYAVINVDKQKDINWFLNSFIKKNLGYKILISKGDLETKKLGKYKERFILDENLAKNANISCTPTIIIFENNQYVLQEIKISGETYGH